MPGNEQLSRDAWLDAATSVVAESGFDNVRIAVLAEKLGVSRGSFYWHFQDHAEFISSYLAQWKAKRLNELVYWRPASGDPQSELHRVIDITLNAGLKNPKRLRVELAVRDYARRDKLAAQIVAEVDQAGMAQVVPVLENVMKEPSEELALALFATVLGGQVMLAGRTTDAAVLVQAVERLVDRVIEGATKSGR